MTAVGSSPATYGLAFAAALLCRPTTLCCAPFGSFGSLPLWVWPGLLGVNELVLAFVEKDGSKDAFTLQGTVPNERKEGGIPPSTTPSTTSMKEGGIPPSTTPMFTPTTNINTTHSRIYIYPPLSPLLHRACWGGHKNCVRSGRSFSGGYGAGGARASGYVGVGVASYLPLFLRADAAVPEVRVPGGKRPSEWT